jgi:hypothetical protein
MKSIGEIVTIEALADGIDERMAEVWHKEIVDMREVIDSAEKALSPYKKSCLIIGGNPHNDN